MQILRSRSVSQNGSSEDAPCRTMMIAAVDSPNADLLITTGVVSILATALAFWLFLMARDPKHWRFWWMARFGMTNLNSDRDLRRKQERYLAIGSSVLCLLVFALSLSCAIWTKLSIDEIRSVGMSKTSSSKPKNLSANRIPKRILKPGERFIP